MDGTALLRGVSVLEISGRVAGAYCGHSLARLGATVTRVKMPLVAYARPEVSTYLERALAAGKRSLETDDPELERLVTDADVVVVDVLHEDAVDGAATALAAGLVGRRPPGAPLVDLTQFGCSGGGLERPGTPLTACAAAAMSWAIGDPAREPLTLPSDIPDYLLGSEAAAAACLLLLGAREGSLEEARAEVASADVLAYYVGMIATNFVGYGRPWHRSGAEASGHGGSYPAALFPCADGAVAIMCRQPREWVALMEAMGNPEWSHVPHLQDPREVARGHVDEVDPQVRAWILEHTIDQLFALGRLHGFPVAPLRDADESLTDEQLRHRGFFAELAPAGSADRTVSVPGTPFQIADSSPGDGGRRLDALGEAGAPLAGLRVLDFSWVWSGPTVTAALADLGADVIKIESESRPDSARVRGAGIRADGTRNEGPPLELSPYFNQVSHGKRSVSIDITEPEGREAAMRLAAESDIVVENMRPGALARRGLGFEDLREANPSLVMLSMSVAGRDGPLASIGGYATVMSGLGGLEALVRYPDSDPMGLKNLALADPNGATHALAALMAALINRVKTGEGCWIDLSQTECVSCVMLEPLLEAQLLGAVRVPANSHPIFHPHGHFRCAGEDRWIAVAARTDAERDRLATAIGADRSADLESALIEWLSSRDAEVAERILVGVGVPAAELRSFDQLAAHGWAASATIDHPYVGPREIVSLPWRVDGRNFPPRGRSPLLGEHTAALLGAPAG